jgi:mRNA interferase MazF
MVSPVGYIPERGDVVWIDFDPRTGSEQSGQRPALVLSRAAYNRFGLCLLCPVTSKIKGYPFEVVLPEGLAVRGAVLCDHVRSVDWRVRLIKKAGEITPEALERVTFLASGLIQGK